jgi:two-component system NarL family sensor kinase
MRRTVAHGASRAVFARYLQGVTEASGQGGLRRKHPTATVVIALCGLAPFLVIIAVTADARVLDPLVPVLLVGAAASNVMDVRYEGRLWVSGSFLCCLMAAAVLGPFAGAVVALGSEIAASAWCRFPLAPFAVNCLGAVAPTWMAGALLAASAPLVGSEGFDFDIALGLIACLALTANIVLVSSLMGLHEQLPLLRQVRAYRRLVPLLGANVVLLVAITQAYYRVGVASAIFLVVVMLVFTYVVRLFVDARERARQVEELSMSRGRLVAEALNAEERARRALAQELHDDALQSLLAAKQDLEEAREGDDAGLARADAAVQATLIKLRDAVFELHPSILEHAGLEPALVAVATEQGRRAGFHVHVSVDANAAGVNDHLLFSLARELITNVAKHAQAQTLWVSLTRDDRDVELRVRDDGRGFDPSRRIEAVHAGHIGLASNVERVEAVRGELQIDTEPGSGTDVRIRLPVPQIQRVEVAGREPATQASRDA